MPRETLDLSLFNVGLVSKPDAEDIPNEAQVEGSYNLDPDSEGKLAGIYKQVSASIYGYDGTKFGWISRTDGKWDLLYTNGTWTKVITDFYGTQANAYLVGMTGIPITSVVSNNQEAHISTGRDNPSAWAGYISHGHFDGFTPSGLQVTICDLTAPATTHFVQAVANPASTEEEAQFPKGNEYEYKFSFVYDGYQESPLGGTGDTVQITTNVDKILATIYLTSYANINKRITGIRIYRRERPFFDSALWTSYEAFIASIRSMPRNLRNRVKDKFKKFEDSRLEIGELGAWGEYKLVKDISIVESTGWVTDGGDKGYAFQDNNKPGSTYYANTGIDDYSDIYDDNTYNINRELSVACNDALFVGNISHPQIPEDDGAHMIIRSKSGRFDMFDWVNDKIILPVVPTALASHRGKLYAFSANSMFIIDPNNLVIIEEVRGRGCSSQQSIVQTDYGLFWANKNGVYWSTLTEELLQPIKDNLSEPIKAQYQTAAEFQTPHVVYNSQKGQLLVHLNNDIYAYSPALKRWDFYSDYKAVSQEEVCGSFIGKDGETYTVTDNDLYKDFGDAYRKPWVYISKKFTMGEPSQIKKIYKIPRDGDSVTVYYSLDGGDWTIITDSDFVEEAKTIQLKVIGAYNVGVLRSISIIFRRLIGKR